MSDRFDELHRLQQLGLDVTPLPASEVRRRGDRMRRRNHALAAVGGIAAVALIAVPLALTAGGSNRSAPEPGPATQTPTPSALRAVPADFDLTAVPPGMAMTFASRNEAVITDLTPCQLTAFTTITSQPAPAPLQDTAGAIYGEPGTESMAARTLAVYVDESVARAALDQLSHALTSCTTDMEGPNKVRWDLTSFEPGSDRLIFTKQYDYGGGLLADLTTFEAVRVGNALLLVSESTSAGGPTVVPGQVRRIVEMTVPVVAQMCVFTDQGC